MPNWLDDAGELAARLGKSAPAGYLTYSPGPGLYSRLEKAVEAMPENVRVKELPGLLKRYKDGVPGWELKATDLDSVIAGRDVVPREELLGAVRERSPVYTHGEVVLGGTPQRGIEPVETESGGQSFVHSIERQGAASRIGEGVSHGDPLYSDYGQGGTDYAELLLTQPGQSGLGFGSHWSGTGKPQDQAVAHARYDTHGDALRINELQSDLGIHNRKVREAVAREEAMGPEAGAIYKNKEGAELPFPMEDAWSDVLIKRLALEAARKGHRAIEVASPRAIADKVGGNIDNYEHFYGKVVPGAIERLGRRMGGLTDESDLATVAAASRVRGSGDESAAQLDRIVGLADLPDVDGTKYSGLRMAAERLLGDLGHVTHRENASQWAGADFAGIKQNIANNLAAVVGPQRMNEMYLRANEIAAAHAARRHADNLVTDSPMPPSINPPGRRYIMSDEMRRRLIQEGIGASLLAPIAGAQMNEDR